MIKDITNNPQSTYIISKPGDHVFYFENLSTDITFIIDTEDADVQIYGLYQGKNADTFTTAITQVHNKPNSTSTTLIKSVLDDASQLNFTGTIRIEKDAQNSKATLTNKNLLLSEKASALSNPQLEVLPHEVECTHAAVTTPLDHDQLSYLTARGISENEAEKLLIDGFIAEITQYREK